MFQKPGGIKRKCMKLDKMLIYFVGTLLCFLVGNVESHAQQTLPADVPVTLNVQHIAFGKVLQAIESQTDYRFAYNTELIAKQKDITMNIHQMPLKEVCILLFKNANLEYAVLDHQIILSESEKPLKVTLCGYVRDSTTGESLPGAVIYFPKLKTGTYTNNYGFYSITQNQQDSVSIIVSYIGYQKTIHILHNRSSSSLNFYLKAVRNQLESILITDKNKNDNVNKDLAGKTEISQDMLHAGPSLMSNGDIMNTIEMMPGVVAGLEGRPGYFIRGGNTDQNLVQLDEATLYNPGHFLGLISIFNTSAIKSSTLLKGGFPASFGDHLSSVLDITMKDGNNQQLGGDIQLGTIAGGFTLSGPLVDDKASFLIAARRSTVDLLLQPFNISNYYSNYNFYDLNAKLNFRLSQKDRLYFSFYQGRDYSAYATDSAAKNGINYKVNYGNQAFTFRWNHLYSQKLFTNTSVVYNNYYHFLTARQDRYYAALYSGIRDIEFKTDVNYYPSSNQKINMGIHYRHQILFPSSVSDRSVSNETNISINPSDIIRKYGNRYAAYFSDEVWINPRLMAYLGGRLPLCYIADKHYINFEPRLALLYTLNPATSVKVSYTHMHQYLHLVQGYNASFPAEIWIGSSAVVKPQDCRQASLGLFRNFRDAMFQASTEVYYKKLGNQLMFRGGLNPIITANIENTLIFGQGQNYGAELFLRKTSGRLTGWLSYTLSYASQQFDSLNLGHQFPAANDRRHCLYILTSYALNDHWGIASNFLLASGRAFTLFKNISTSYAWWNNPLYYTNDPGSNGGKTGFDNLSEQNNFRLQPYNRLDISISYRNTRKLQNRNLETAWVFSLNNVYARANTFFAYCSIDPVTKQPVAVQVSFVPVIPSLSYNLKF